MLAYSEVCILKELKKQIFCLTLAAMFTAMSVVIGIFCKSFLNFGTGLFRITFEGLPIILSGILLGPVYGGFVGVSTDLISYFLSPQPYPINPIVTLGSMLLGLIAGLISKLFIKKRGYTQIIVSSSVAHIISSMIIKPIGLFAFYSWAVVWRIPVYLAITPLEITVMCLLYKNKNFRQIFEKL